MIQSELITFLFDPLVGGSPQAFKCKLDGSKKTNRLAVAEFYPCGAVTRTLSGMRSHQRAVHAVTPQAKLPIRTEAGNERTHADDAKG